MVCLIPYSSLSKVHGKFLVAILQEEKKGKFWNNSKLNAIKQTTPHMIWIIKFQMAMKQGWYTVWYLRRKKLKGSQKLLVKVIAKDYLCLDRTCAALRLCATRLPTKFFWDFELLIITIITHSKGQHIFNSYICVLYHTHLDIGKLFLSSYASYKYSLSNKYLDVNKLNYRDSGGVSPTRWRVCAAAVTNNENKITFHFGARWKVNVLIWDSLISSKQFLYGCPL